MHYAYEDITEWILELTYLVYYCYVRVDSFTPSWQFMTKLRIINLMKISSKYYINIHSFVQFMNEDTCSWRPSEFLQVIQHAWWLIQCNVLISAPCCLSRISAYWWCSCSLISPRTTEKHPLCEAVTEKTLHSAPQDQHYIGKTGGYNHHLINDLW